MPPTATPARSTSTSATCVRSSSATPRSRSTSSPCAEWATASATRDSRPGATRMPGPRSIQYRLTLLFFAITLTAFAGIYLYVVPQLETNLREQKLRDLSDSARVYSGDLVRAIGSKVDESQVRRAVRRAADRSNVRVTLLGVSRGTQGIQTYPISDSTNESRVDRFAFQVAEDAARSGRTRSGSEATGNGRLGEAARPLFYKGKVARVVVYSTPLNDVETNVALIRRRVARAVAPDQAPRAGGGEGGRRRLLAVDPAGLRRRARPARQGVQRHAAPARPARHGAKALHRNGLPRAAHADLLPGGLRRAAPGRGARGGRAPAVPGPDPRADRTPAEAGLRAPRPVKARGRLARAPARADRRRRPRPQRGDRVHPGPGPARRAPRAAPVPQSDRGRVRSRARGPDHADPDRQRAVAHPPGDRRVRERHAGQRERAPRGARPRPGHPP